MFTQNIFFHLEYSPLTVVDGLHMVSVSSDIFVSERGKDGENGRERVGSRHLGRYVDICPLAMSTHLQRSALTALFQFYITLPIFRAQLTGKYFLLTTRRRHNKIQKMSGNTSLKAPLLTHLTVDIAGQYIQMNLLRQSLNYFKQYLDLESLAVRISSLNKI